MAKNKTKLIEAEAYHRGAHGVSQEDALHEVEAHFEALREESSRAVTDRIKNLEATTKTLTERLLDADERWQRMSASTSGRQPEFQKPLLAIGVAFLLIIADGLLLAPVMDGLNIADPTSQIVVAIVLVTAFSALFKIAVHNYRQPQRKRWLVITPATFGLLALAVFGWWRATEVVFASLRSGDDLNTFAADNPVLTKIFLASATVALPVAAALALDYGFEKLRHGVEWAKARRDHLRFSKALDHSEKKLEAAIEKRDHEREKLAHVREEWLNAARQAHAEGDRLGAHQEPFSSVLLRVIPIGMLIVVAVFVVSYWLIDKPLADYIISSLARLLLYALTALGLTGWYAGRAVHQWNRPTALQLYEARPTHWAGSGPAQQNRRIPA
jgi:cation transport ATPase